MKLFFKVVDFGFRNYGKVWAILLAVIVPAFMFKSCSNPEPRDNRTYMPQGIAAIPTQPGIVTKELDTVYIRTVPVIRYVQVTSDSTYTETRKYIKPTTPPPVVVDPPVTETGAPAGMKRVVNIDFENGSTGVSSAAASQQGAGRVVDYNGSKQFRAYVAAGSAPVHSGYRSELRYENISDAGRTFYQFDITFVKIPNTGEVQFWQVHPQSSTGSSLLRLQCQGSKFSVVRNPSGRNFYENVSKPIVLGKKYRIAIDANWSNGSDGWIKVTIDGEPFYSFKGITGIGYSKFFINCWSSTGGSPTQTVEVYGDNISIYKP